MKVLIIICRVLFVVVGVFGFVDIGQGTLCEIIAEHFSIFQTWSIAIVSVMVGAFGALSSFPLKKQEHLHNDIEE